MAALNTSERIAEYVHSHFLKGAAMQKGSTPGFSHAMKLSYNLIDTKRMSFDIQDKKFTYRYALSDDVPKFTIGLLSAMMDELTTDACFSIGLPCPPGVSLQMHTEILPNPAGNHFANPLEDPDVKELDIVVIVTKLGKTVSYMRTEYRHPLTNHLFGFSTHVKYMPTGSAILDFVFSRRSVYELYERFVLRKAIAPIYEEKPLFTEVIGKHLEFHAVGRASFTVTGEHTNPFGALYGGCHAMIMEIVAESYAKEELKSTKVFVEAMHIDFISAGKGTVSITCETISKSEARRNVHVRVKIQRGDRTCSEAKLRISGL